MSNRQHKDKGASASTPTGRLHPPSLASDALRLEIATLESRASKLRHEADDMNRDNASFLKHSVSKVGHARRNDLEAQGLDNFVDSIVVAREYRHSIRRDAHKKVKEAEECERKAGEARRKLARVLEGGTGKHR